MEGLAKDGHEVTIVSPFQLENPPENYKQIFIETSYEFFVKGKVNPFLFRINFQNLSAIQNHLQTLRKIILWILTAFTFGIWHLHGTIPA